MPSPAIHLTLLLLAAASAHAAFPEVGEWPCFRGGPTLQARSPLEGNITDPHIAWKQFTGSLRTHVAIEPAAVDTTLALPDPQAPLAVLDTSDPRWGLSLPMAEIDGQQRPIARDGNTTYADVTPDFPGLEKLQFDSGFAIPTVNGQWQPCRGHAFGWKDGAWVQLWQTELIDMLFSALPLTGDFDGDGNLEIAFLPWYDLVILDARNGAIKYRCKFTTQRSYGYFGAWDLDGDGRQEFLVQADFCKHVDVLGLRDGQLKLLWQWEIEPDISNPQKIFRAYPHPVADVDGDGKPELVLSVYNAEGDHRWHVTIHDPLTGAKRSDLPGESLDGLFDLDGDGACELLTTVTPGASAPPYGTIRVRSLRGGNVGTLWEGGGLAWATWDPPLPPNVNSGATNAQRDALCRPTPGGAWVAIPSEGPTKSGAPSGPRIPAGPELLVGRWIDGRFTFGMKVRGSHLRPIALASDGALLASCTTASARPVTLQVAAGQAKALCADYPGGALGVPAVVRPPAEARPTIVAQGQDEELVAFHPPSADQPAVERWRLPGRAQSANWPWDGHGPVLADLRADGGRQVIYATASPEGFARLVAADLDQRELWHHDFPDIPGTPPVWNTGGIILWQVGHLTDPRTFDVVVTVRRSMMHSEETYALSGRDGHELWHRDRHISNRGVGGTPFALADFDGDGLDDVASFHPSLLYILEASTGRDLIAKDASWPGVPAQPVYWGLPLAGDFEGSGRASLFFATERRSMTGLVRADGSLAWWDALDLSPEAMPAVGDFNGDGKLEVIGVGYENGIRCYDTATGRVEWTLPVPVPGTPRGAASADLNADGRDEALFTTGRTLWCLGLDAAGTAGRLLWTLDLPSAVGPPTIADLDGQGRASILLLGADRWVYCVQ